MACCNFIPQAGALREFALEHGFAGVDWSFTQENVPRSPAQERDLGRTIAGLYPLEVRYHCALNRTDLGDEDPGKAQHAKDTLRRICRLVSKLGGRFLTIHVGLGRDSTLDLCWDRTMVGLAELVRYASSLKVRLCLENLAWGWTSRPDLFEKLLRLSGAWGTFDLGHAQVSPSVLSRHYHLEDFVLPHPEVILNAHVYHAETEDGHLPPESLADLEERFLLLWRLALCDWWVLELREEPALLKTLEVVRDFFDRMGG